MPQVTHKTTTNWSGGQSLPNNHDCCNNCGKVGHLQHQCKMPIISTGMIIFRNRSRTSREYLMICRKDSLGYVDFMRSKYSIYNKHYLLNMFFQMTTIEKQRLKTWTFDALWCHLWGGYVDLSSTAHIRNDNDLGNANNNSSSNSSSSTNTTGTSSNSRRNDDAMMKDRFHSLIGGISNRNSYYDLYTLINESESTSPPHYCITGNLRAVYTEPEWGFPKGRKNSQEKDLQCALREFGEETGYLSSNIHVIENVLPFEEIFTGSNYKSYKHKYFLGYMPASIKSKHALSVASTFTPTDASHAFDLSGACTMSSAPTSSGPSAPYKRPTFQESEVSRMEWCTLDECLEKIRPYNIEKRRMISNVDQLLQRYSFKLSPVLPTHDPLFTRDS